MANATLSLKAFGSAALTEEVLLPRLAWLKEVVSPRLERFMGYYRNTVSELASVLPCGAGTSFAVRPFRQYQELGLPARITGFRRASSGAAVPTGAIDVHRKEVVIENDIGWRINTLVDFAASHEPAINSTASDPKTRAMLTQVVSAILETAGGVRLLQNLVLHGAISGSAWVQIRPTAALLERLSKPTDSTSGGGAAITPDDEDIASMNSTNSGGADGTLRVSDWLAFEIVTADRVCPLPQAGAFAAVVHDVDLPGAATGRDSSLLDRFWSWFSWGDTAGDAARQLSFDLFSPTHWQRYVNGVLVEEGANPLGMLPLVKYENQSDPAAGLRAGPAGSGAVDTGISDVEPLIPLQDELNTRLSDRAYRVTMTSFRMYLGRGIEDFTKRPVGPGQMWATDNPDAAIDVFGGDSSTPSEDTHISEVREAMDKISGVSPVAAGQLGSKIGHLTSAVALRLTLIALLTRTDRKRAALNQTLSQLVNMVLGILDRAGILHSKSQDRGIEVNWPTPLPDSDLDKLQEAQLKISLGVPREKVLEELGYGELVEGKASDAEPPAMGHASGSKGLAVGADQSLISLSA